MGKSGSDKALTLVGGIPLIVHCLHAFQRSQQIEHILVVYRESGQQRALASVLDNEGLNPARILWAQGGEERQDSVFHALSSLPVSCDFTFIHDTARPFVTSRAIKLLATAVQRDGAAVLAHKSVDTLKRVPSGTLPYPGQPSILEDLERDRLWGMETPQVFAHQTILEAYRKLRQEGKRVTDDTAAAVHLGVPVTLVENPFPNPKLTYPSDLPYLQYLWDHRADLFFSAD